MYVSPVAHAQSQTVRLHFPLRLAVRPRTGTCFKTGFPRSPPTSPTSCQPWKFCKCFNRCVRVLQCAFTKKSESNRRNYRWRACCLLKLITTCCCSIHPCFTLRSVDRDRIITCYCSIRNFTLIVLGGPRTKQFILHNQTRSTCFAQTIRG